MDDRHTNTLEIIAQYRTYEEAHALFEHSIILHAGTQNPETDFLADEAEKSLKDLLKTMQRIIPCKQLELDLAEVLLPELNSKGFREFYLACQIYRKAIQTGLIDL